MGSTAYRRPLYNGGGGNLGGARWNFGDFELDSAEFQLLDRSRPVKLERIPLDLLILLVERHGQLVSRDEIADRLWGNSVHVDVESGLNTAVRKLRSALKDSLKSPVFIETISSKGYRFIAPVSKVTVPASAGVIPDRRKRVWTIAGYAVAAVAVAALVYYAGFRHGGPTGVIAPVTIAVLPFQNLSNDPEQEYFGEGLTEETIAALGRVSPSRIRVIARTSSMAYKTSRKTAAQIGAELSATYLVEGSVRRDPEGVRITAKLIRVQDQVQLWSTSYDRSAAGSLGDQDEIGNAIAGEIGAKLSAVPGKGPARGHTVNADAYDLYLRGRYSLNRRTLDFLRRSSEYFEAAVEKDPSYARAYAGIAEALVFETFITGTNAADQWRKVRLATDKALSLDPELSEAHATAGIADFFMGWDWGAAERSFRRAIALNPNNATAHFYYAHLLSNSLRHDEALAHIQKARVLDPISPMMHTFAGQFLFLARRYDQALTPLQEAITIDKDFFVAHAVLGYLYEQTGQPERAIEEFRNAYRLSGGNLLQLANQAFVLGRIGRSDEAQQMLTTMEQISHSRFVPPYLFALVYAGLGDRNETFRWLEKSYIARDILMVFLSVDPKWDSVRSDERFVQLLRRCRFRP